MVDSYPLRWPPGIPRTKQPKHSRFDTPHSKAVNNLFRQLRLLGAKNPIISSNLETYERGGRKIPYANQRVEDSGVAVYFEYEGRQHCIPCDRWKTIGDNIHAVGKTVSAMRGIERWGTYEMMRATFQGFKALPPGTDEEYGIEKKEPHYFQDCNSMSELKETFRELVKVFHSDKGGNDMDMAVINKQYRQKKQQLEETIRV